MLLDIVKQIVTRYGEQILFDPKRINASFLDLAKDEPKPPKQAFIECLEFGVVKVLKGVANSEERFNCKETLARRLRDEEGLDVELYRKAIDILCEVLFGSVPNSVVVIAEATFNLYKDPRDGNVYSTVKIGSQVWMAENLNYKIGGSWCYDNDEANGKKYGRLYTWDAAKVACPTGWHLPTRQEWDELVATAGGPKIACKKLKAIVGWYKNGNGTDDYGFSALPGGYRYTGGGFFNAGNEGNWWTATEHDSDYAYGRGMCYIFDYLGEHGYYKSDGLSVRCVQD